MKATFKRPPSPEEEIERIFSSVSICP